MPKVRLSDNSDNLFYTNNSSLNNINSINNLTNITNIEPITNNYHSNICPKDNINLTDDNHQNNNYGIKNSPKQIENIHKVKFNIIIYILRFL
jgi:hypothetical protein